MKNITSEEIENMSVKDVLTSLQNKYEHILTLKYMENGNQDDLRESQANLGDVFKILSSDLNHSKSIKNIDNPEGTLKQVFDSIKLSIETRPQDKEIYAGLENAVKSIYSKDKDYTAIAKNLGFEIIEEKSNDLQRKSELDEVKTKKWSFKDGLQNRVKSEKSRHVLSQNKGINPESIGGRGYDGKSR